MPSETGHFTLGVCQEIWNHSAAVVQDDSGVPFRLFDPNRWKVQLYGEYEQPFEVSEATGSLRPSTAKA